MATAYLHYINDKITFKAWNKIATQIQQYFHSTQLLICSEIGQRLQSTQNLPKQNSTTNSAT